MCGFAGYVDHERSSSREALTVTVQNMAGRLLHRGPDDRGSWVDPEAGVAFGHCRLSIVDLSPAGHQPMISSSGRYVLAYNGEIYNFRQLRSELVPLLRRDGFSFRGHSDTEVMLAAFEYWGVDESVRRFNGMFAFALWDRWERVLYLGRDRFGEKPLYYGWMGSAFLFASELKALRAHPKFKADIDVNAIALHLRYNCIPSPLSVYRNLRKLPPGTVLTWKDGHERLCPYWSLLEVARQGVAEPFAGCAQDAIDELQRLLQDAVRLRLISDVPLGAFLSGGVDSSTIVALMQEQGTHPVRTFSVGSDDEAYDEAGHAHSVAHHLRTEHTELHATAEEAIALIPRLGSVYDEPFADSSQIPTFLVSQLARRYVTVSLSGDGGDEVFGGYNRHTWSRRIWKRVGWLPVLARRMAAAAITSVPPKRWDTLFSRLIGVLPRDFRQTMPGYKLHKLADVLPAAGPNEMYLRLASHWFHPESVVAGADAAVAGVQAASQNWPDLPTFEQQAMYLDSVTYLTNDILTKLDRASMAVGLEARVPYLDHRVVEFAWRLPMSMKIRDNQGKWILREVLYRYVPRELVDRPKMGFGIPLNTWLRGPLREWAEGLLDPKRLAEEGFFDVAAIRQKWTEHLRGTNDWQFHIWDVLMFQSWWEQNHGNLNAGVAAAMKANGV